MATRQLPVVSALAAVSAASALAFGRVFASDRYVLGVLGAAVLPHLIGWVVRSRTRSGAVGIAASVIGLVVYVAGAAGSIDPATLARRLGNGWDLVQQRAVPLPATGGPILLTIVVIWVTATVADDLAFRRRAALGALSPGVMVLVWVLALGTDDGAAITVAAFGAAAVCFLALQHQSLLDWRRTRLGRAGPLGAPRLLALGLVTGLVAVSLGVAAADAIPGGDKPLFSVSGLGDDAGAKSYRTTIAPLLDVADKLKQGTMEELFTVRAGTGDYWRVTALDEYRGIGGGQWTLTAEGEDAVSRGLDGDVPADALTQEFRIGPLGERWMPAAYKPIAVSLDDTLVVRASSTLVTGSDEVSGLRYKVRSEVPIADTTEAAARATNAPVPKALRRYTTLPVGFSDSVRGQAVQLTQSVGTPFDKAKALRDFFRSSGEFVYDTNVEPADDEEAIQNFLVDKRGFCVQFASAYAVMARAVGIPARVAVGFTPGVRGARNTFRVTNFDAHAWPEVWIAGLGWTHIFDPTPASDTPGGSALPGETPEGSTPPQTTPATTQVPGTTPNTGAPQTGATTPASTPGGPGGVTVDPKTEQDAGWSLTTWLVLLALLAVVLGAGTALAIVATKSRRRAARRSRREPSAAVSGAWEETLERLRDHGVFTPPTETPLELATRVPRETMPEVEPPLRAVASAYTAARYGHAPTRPEVARETWRQVDALRDVLAAASGFRRRWRTRV